MMLDRRMHPIKIMDKNDELAFPIPDYVDNKVKEIENTSKGDGLITISPFVAINKKGEIYFEILVYDNVFWYKKDNAKIKRFIIREGYALGEEEEKDLLKYCRTSFVLDDEDYNSFIDEVIMCFPEINMIYYYEIGISIEHIYYTTHESGVKGILYKNGLGYLAAEIYMFDECNVLGKTPEEILGLPIECLKIFNNYYMSVWIHEKKQRIKVRYVYNKYLSYMNEDLPNRYQWEYIYGIEYDEKYVGESMDDNYYRLLSNVLNDDELYLYNRYRELVLSFSDKQLPIKYPLFSNIHEEINRLEELLENSKSEVL